MESNEKSKFIIDAKSAAVLFAGLFFTSIIAQSMQFFSSRVFGINLMENDWFWLLVNIISFVLPIAAMYEICLKPKNQSFEFSFKLGNKKKLALVIFMMIGLMMIVEFLVSLIPTTGPVFGDWHLEMEKLFRDLSKKPVLMVLMVVVSAPILEEILFRGIIMKGMLNKGVSPKRAIILSALIFGIVHGNPWQFVGASILGLFLGWVYFQSQSLLPVILLHATNNLVSFLLFQFATSEDLYEFLGISEYVSLGIGCVIFSVSFLVYLKYFTQKNQSFKSS